MFSSADSALRRYVSLRERLAAPKGGGGVLHSGLVYAHECSQPACATSARKRELRERAQVRRGEAPRKPTQPWVQKGVGRAPHRTYMPVCRLCGTEWRIETKDVRSRDVSHSGGDGPIRSLTELGKLACVFRGLDLWTARVWHLRVLGPVIAEVSARNELARGDRYKLALGVHTTWTWEDVADVAKKRWPRKHAGTYFSARKCSTLVYEAREHVEIKLWRAKLWDGPKPESVERVERAKEGRVTTPWQRPRRRQVIIQQEAR